MQHLKKTSIKPCSNDQMLFSFMPSFLEQSSSAPNHKHENCSSTTQRDYHTASLWVFPPPHETTVHKSGHRSLSSGYRHCKLAACCKLLFPTGSFKPVSQHPTVSFSSPLINQFGCKHAGHYFASLFRTLCKVTQPIFLLTICVLNTSVMEVSEPRTSSQTLKCVDIPLPTDRNHHFHTGQPIGTRMYFSP